MCCESLMAKTEQENTQDDIDYMLNKITDIENKIGSIIEEQHNATDTAKKIHAIKQQIIQNRLTCAIVIFTAVTILVNILMWNQMAKQTKANETEANASNDAIKLTLQEMNYRHIKDSKDDIIARENYIEENRPFVFPDCPTMDTTRYGNIIAYLPIVNHGNTPAYRVNRCISFQRGKTLRNPKNFEYDSIWTWMTLAPHSTETMVILNDKWDTSLTAFPYVVGSIWYNDNWSNRLHHTTFAYKWIHKYGDRFVRQYQLESVDRYEENQTND
jgi:hypothetical protein